MALNSETFQTSPLPAFGDVLKTPPASPSASPEWGSDPVPLKDYSLKRQVPGFAKVVKGSYMTLGASKFSLTKQHQEVFIHSVKVSVKVLAHCLKKVETTGVSKRGSHNLYKTTRLYAVDQRLAIPISYQGWFELLSEDGKSARPICSVHELSKVKPSKVLVRENMKCYLLNENTKLTFDKSKVVLAGDQLTLNGEISLPSSTEGKKVKLLRCLDSNRENIYLSFDQKGTFTPIAGENDIAGVFSIRDVVRRFRLPLTVKLVQGIRPKVDTSRFTGMVRLDWVYTDETAFVCPIEKHHVRLLPVPSDANLQLSAATNQDALKCTELYATMMAKCTRMIGNYNNTLHLIVQVPNAASKGKDRHSNANVFSIPLEADGGAVKSQRTKVREERIMDEIDDLYGYVRDGGPPPSNVKFSYDSDEESYWEEPAYEPLDDFRARLNALEAGEKVSYPAKYQPQDPSKLNLEVDIIQRKQSVSSGNGIVSSAPLSAATYNGKPAGETSLKVLSPPVAAPPPLPHRPDDIFPSNNDNQKKGSPTQIASSILGHAGSGSGSGSGGGSVTSHPSTPIRRYSHQDGVATVSNLGLVSSSQVSLVSPPPNPTSSPPPNLVSTPPSHLISSPPSHGPLMHRQMSLGMVDLRQTASHKRSIFLNAKSKSVGSQNSSGGSSGSKGRRSSQIARDFKDSDISSIPPGGSSGGSSGGPTTKSNVRKKLQTLYL